MPRIAIATCQTIPEPDPDEPLLLDALRERGADAEMLAWDDPASDPSKFDACVLRSTWNYSRMPDRFLAWVEDTARTTKLINPIEAIRWGVHKRYLNELEDRGLPVVPTRIFDKDAPVSLESVADEMGWDDVVVKPAISAASYLTSRFVRDEFRGPGQEWLAAVLRDRDAMIQPYMKSVETGGERALVWIDGMTTHAVAKKPRFADGEESVSHALSVDAAERVLVDHALGDWADVLLYARVDVMADENGAPCISELEIMEPSLFFLQSPPALARFADGLLSRVS